MEVVAYEPGSRRSCRSLPAGCFTISPKAEKKIGDWLANKTGACGTAVLHLDDVVNKLDAGELGFLLQRILCERVPVQVAFLQGATPFQNTQKDGGACFRQLLQLLRGSDDAIDTGEQSRGVHEAAHNAASIASDVSAGLKGASGYRSLLWSINLGETKFSESQLDSLCAALRHPNCGVTHMFYECTTISGERKNEMRQIIRQNRAKHGRWRLTEDAQQNAVVFSCTKCWFNATSHGCNKRWMEIRRKKRRIASAADLSTPWVGDRIEIQYAETDSDDDGGEQHGAAQSPGRTHGRECTQLRGEKQVAGLSSPVASPRKPQQHTARLASPHRHCEAGVAAPAAGVVAANKRMKSVWYTAVVKKSVRPHWFTVEFVGGGVVDLQLDATTRLGRVHVDEALWRPALPNTGDMLCLRHMPPLRDALGSDSQTRTFGAQLDASDKMSKNASTNNKSEIDEWDTYCIVRDSWCVRDSKISDSSDAEQVFDVDVVSGAATERSVGTAELALAINSFRQQWWYECRAEAKSMLQEVQRQYCRRGVGCGSNDGDENEGTWVQCDKCSVWRKLPPGVTDWPGSFTCDQNPDKSHNKCGSTTEDVAASDELQSKKRKLSDSSHAKLVRRKRVRRQVRRQQRWVQCDNCNKWRTMPWHMGEWPKNESFTCNMNTWAPRVASCAAPEQSFSDDDGEGEQDPVQEQNGSQRDQESARGGESRSRKSEFKKLQAHVVQLKKDLVQLEATMESHLAQNVSALRERRQIDWLAQKERLESEIRKVKADLRQIGTKLKQHDAPLAKTPQPIAKQATRLKAMLKSTSKHGHSCQLKEDEIDSNFGGHADNVDADVDANDVHDNRAEYQNEALQPPSVAEFTYAGHPWIGLRVIRFFNSTAHCKQNREIGGRIFAWLPSHASDQALWKVLHDDKDVEDLEKDEASDALKAYMNQLRLKKEMCEARTAELRARQVSRMTSRGQEEWLAAIAQCENNAHVASAALLSFQALFDAGHESHGVLTTVSDNEYLSALAIVDTCLARKFEDVASTCSVAAARRGSDLSPILLRLCDEVGKLDEAGIFATPVAELPSHSAPNYPMVIKDPIDFSTMRQKIQTRNYPTVKSFFNDVLRMCVNALVYNGAQPARDAWIGELACDLLSHSLTAASTYFADG